MHVDIWYTNNLPSIFIFRTDTGETKIETEVESLEPEVLAEGQGPNVESAHEEGLEVENE